jgi:WD40 repeat protein
MKAVPSKDPENFYVVGGTMRHDAPSYVERRADDELFSVLLSDEFCHVLTARQMGKSSLMLRTAARLRNSGVSVAVLDLTAIGQNLTTEQWYSGLVLQLGERLDLEDELLDFWAANTHLGPMQRWVEALRKVVLPKSVGQLVIFIDEIDAVRSLDFSTDEFFAGIRECYNLRNVDEEMRRLSFCLIGVATPSDLIRDTRTTPFNIGIRIELNDFTQEEALSLADGLRWGRDENRAILKRILYWTSGHPYLTQRVCKAVIENKGARNAADIDTLIEELFFSKRAHGHDDNLIFVRERLLRSGADLTALLNLYAKVRRGKAVHDVDSDPLIPILRLSGVICEEKGLLRVRNRIYERVFDKDWVASNLPDFEVRRQREAYRRGMWRTAMVSLLILAVVSGFGLMALWQRNRALEQTEARKQLLYMTQIKLAAQEWDNANVSRVKELLEATKPLPDDKDLRSFEWYLLYGYTHKEVFGLEGTHPVVSVKFMGDNNTLAIGTVSRSMVSNGREYTIKLYNREVGRDISSFTVETKTGFDIVVFSPDLKYVATDSPDNRVILWDINSGERFKEFGGREEASIRAVAFAPAKPYLVSGDGKGVIKIWNIATEQLERTQQVGKLINGITFSPDGRLLAITTETNAVQVLDLETGRIFQPFSIPDGILSHAFFSPDGNRLAVTAQDGKLFIWDVSTRRILPLKINHSREISSLAFSPDGKTLATGSLDRTVKLWEMATGNPLQLIRGHGSKIKYVDWSSDGKYLVTGASDGTVKIWDAFPKILPLKPGQAVKSYYAAAFSPVDELIALGTTDDSHMKVWNLSTGEELSDLGELHDEILCAAFSKEARLVAFSYGGSFVGIYDVYTGKRVRMLNGIKSAVKGLAFSPDGKMIVSGGGQEHLMLWEVFGELEPTPLKSGNSYYCAAFSPDGKWLASADGDGSIQLWDIASLKIVNTFPGHTGMIRSIAFSQDGRLMASGADDNTVRLWDVATGKGLAQPAQADSIMRIAFTPDRKRLVTGGRDGSVIIWNTQDLQEVLNLRGFTGEVTCVTFSGNGTTLAVSSSDGTVTVWQAASAEESGIDPG